MKSWIYAAGTAALLMLGSGTVRADDWTLPGGEILPLGRNVTVWEGKNSYLAPKVDEMLKSPELSGKIAEELIRLGVYGKDEKKAAQKTAEAAAAMLRESRVYQLRGVQGTTLYTACALSLPMELPLTEEETARWKAWAEKAKTPLKGHGELAESIHALSEAAGLAEQESGRSKGGVSYTVSHVYAAPEIKGYAIPFYAFALGTTKDSRLTLTVVLTDQASGAYFEPFLKRGVEAAR